ncbi:MAG: lipid A hydroxylase LpxO, partial [Alphaproteobacteria bacterium]|nr:lipid A hydroxylase LpxO [Alphaproteobacteria bacterium]
MGYALCALFVHRRGRVRLRFDRQFVDHSGVFAPYNLLMYAFSAVVAEPFIDRRRFPIMDIVQQGWETLREETLCLLEQHHLSASMQHDDASFNSFFRQGWKRFYLKWYGDPLPSAA